MVRGTGKFKTKRGGGRNFSKHLVLDENGTAVSTDKRWAKTTSDDDSNSDEESEEESSEESSEEEAPPGGSAPAPELTRAERREAKRAQGPKAKAAAAAAGPGHDNGEEVDEDLINPNHVATKLKISDLGAPRELSRREKEEKEKKDAKDRYWQLHLQGKTDQAKTDLARLAKIRADREAALEKRKAETEAKTAEIEAKKKAQLAGKKA